MFVHGAKYECMHASLQTVGFRNFRIFRIFESSELQWHQDKCPMMYQQAKWSSHPINFTHTHTHTCSYYLIMFGAEWRYVWVSFKACRPVQWTWDMRIASLEISDVMKYSTRFRSMRVKVFYLHDLPAKYIALRVYMRHNKIWVTYRVVFLTGPP